MRAWQRGWPSVYCARARVLHLHRATTSRYFTAAQLERAFEYNYVRFLARAVADRRTFRRLWRENVVRLNLLRDLDALAFASGQPTHRPRNRAPTAFLHLVNGDVAVFPGRPRSRKPMVLVASPYIPIAIPPEPFWWSMMSRTIFMPKCWHARRIGKRAANTSDGLNSKPKHGPALTAPSRCRSEIAN